MAWFTPECPVSEEEKEWIEKSFQWLLEEYSENTFLETEMILPDDPRFPNRIYADDRTIHQFLDVVCEMMLVPREEIHLSIFDNPEDKELGTFAHVKSEDVKACGLYYRYADKGHIEVESRLTSNPPSLVATIAHELAHHILRSDLVESDQLLNEEFLTDLASIFFGMGIFTANSIFNFEQFTNTTAQGWKASRAGYIDEQTAGYALACFSYMQGEKRPIWKKYLETNPGYYYKKGLQYLVKTGDTRLKVIRQ